MSHSPGPAWVGRDGTRKRGFATIGRDGVDPVTRSHHCLGWAVPSERGSKVGSRDGGAARTDWRPSQLPSHSPPHARGAKWTPEGVLTRQVRFNTRVERCQTGHKPESNAVKRFVNRPYEFESLRQTHTAASVACGRAQATARGNASAAHAHAREHSRGAKHSSRTATAVGSRKEPPSCARALLAMAHVTTTLLRAPPPPCCSASCHASSHVM